MKFAVVLGCISVMGCTFIVNKQAAPSIVVPTTAPTPERTPASSVLSGPDLTPLYAVDTAEGDSRPVVCPDGYILAGGDWNGAARFQQLRSGAWCRTYELTWGPPEIHIFKPRATPAPRPWSEERIRYVEDLAEGSATSVVSMSVEPGQSFSGVVSYVVSAVDESLDRAYQHQARQGHVSFWISNDNGTETCLVTGDDHYANPTERTDGSDLVATSGVLGYTWAASARPSAGCAFTLDAWSSLQQTKLQIFAVTFGIHSGQSNASGRVSVPVTGPPPASSRWWRRVGPALIIAGTGGALTFLALSIAEAVARRRAEAARGCQ